MLISKLEKQRAARMLLSRGYIKYKKNYFIGQRNSEVISGVAIDAPPSAFRIFTFVLPLYDVIDELNLALGDLAYDYRDGKTDIVEGAAYFEKFILPIRTSSLLVEYIEENYQNHGYRTWLYYISLLKSGQYKKAIELNIASSGNIPEKIHDRSYALEHMLRNGLFEQISITMQSWTDHTALQFKDIPFFSV